MSAKEENLLEHLGFNSYNIKTDANDPGLEDISFLLKVARLVPKKAENLNNVDPRLLATYTLSAYEEAAEKYTKAHLWYSLKKIKLEATLGRLIVSSEKAATIAEKSAKASTEYQDASELVALGEAYVKFYSGLLKNFEAAHYWAREREKMEFGGKKMSGYEPHNIEGGELRDTNDSVSGDIEFGK